MQHTFRFLNFLLICFCLNTGVQTNHEETMDIKSKECEWKEEDSPFQYLIRFYEQSVIKNTGCGLELTPKEKYSQTFIHGGVLGDNIYRLAKINYLWKTNLFEKCSTSVDGLGTPLEIAATFYKENYKSFKDAKNYPDGITIVIVPIQVKKFSIPNLRFEGFQEAIEKIRSPWSQTEINYFSSVLWFIPTNYTQYYYTYTSSYKYQDEGEISKARFIITPHDKALFISWEQKSMLSLKSAEWGPLIPKLPVQKCNSKIEVRKGFIGTFDNI